MLKPETIKHIREIENVAYRCVVDVHCFNLVTGNTKKDFWNVVQNAIGDGICILWLHLFGSYTDDLHYINFFNKPDVLALGQEYSKEAVKKRILTVIDYDDEEYGIFWNQVKYCRDKFIAHREINFTGIYPDLNICRLMAEELRVILSEIVEKCKGNPPDDDELFQLHWDYLRNNNKSLYNKYFKLYNARLEDSSDAQLQLHEK